MRIAILFLFYFFFLSSQMTLALCVKLLFVTLPPNFYFYF
jgi:hypothetical protein